MTDEKCREPCRRKARRDGLCRQHHPESKAHRYIARLIRVAGGDEFALRNAIQEVVCAIREAERLACAGIAARCAREREAMIETCRAAGGAIEALSGKASEARRIEAEIRGRTA